MNVPATGVVLGVDVGWSEKKKTTGICALRWNELAIQLSIERVGKDAEHLQRDVIAVLDNKPALAAAVDGPLRRSLDEIGVYRDAEMLLTRGFQRFIGKPGQASSPNGKKLNKAANAVAESLINSKLINLASHKAAIHDLAIVEAFPTSFLGVMLEDGQFPSSGARSDIYFQQLLGPECTRPVPPKHNQLAALIRRLLPNRQIENDLSRITDHEECAAVICAATALCVLAKCYVAVGDRTNGYIILPPLTVAGGPGLQPWAWTLLNDNCPAGAQATIIREPEH